jgi:hypothetical protein
LKRWKKTLPQFEPEPGRKGYLLGLLSPVAAAASSPDFGLARFSRLCPDDLSH